MQAHSTCRGLRLLARTCTTANASHGTHDSGVNCCLARVVTGLGLTAGADSRLQREGRRGNRKGLRQVVSANMKTCGAKTSVVKPAGALGRLWFPQWFPWWQKLLESSVEQSALVHDKVFCDESWWSAASARVVEVLSGEGWELRSLMLHSGQNWYSLPFFLVPGHL